MADTAPPTHRRWFRFSLATMFMVMALVAALLAIYKQGGKEAYRRVSLRRFAEAHDFKFRESEAQLPLIRRLMGDRLIVSIGLPRDIVKRTSPMTIEQVREVQRAFPEKEGMYILEDGDTY